MLGGNSLNSKVLNSGSSDQDKFIKWLKKLFTNYDATQKNFQSNKIKAVYDSDREVVIILNDPTEDKEYSREKIEDTFQDPNEFKNLISEMLAKEKI